MIHKILHTLKMGWMFSWRGLLFSAFFLQGRHSDAIMLGAIVLAFVLAFVFRRTIRIFPLLKLFTGRQWIYDFTDPRSYDSQPRQQAPQSKQRQTGSSRPQPLATPHVSTAPVVPAATRNGRTTGYEPRTLAADPLPRGGLMVGTPGAGLQGATNMSQTNIALGTTGEANFAKVLKKQGMLNKFHTIWSVPVPDANVFKPGPYGTDIDCVIGTATAIFLVDLKNYKSGDVRYYSRGNMLYCEDVATGNQVGQPKEMSRNMEMATSVSRKHFPHANIVPVVVFMPTDKGEGVLDNVVWPGGVPAMNLTDFLQVLASQGGALPYGNGDPNTLAAIRFGRLASPAPKTLHGS